MSPARLDWLARLLNARPLTLRLDQATEMRLRAYGDRINRGSAEDGDMEPYDLDSDEDLGSVLLHAAERGIEVNERANRLAGSIFGDVLSAEVMDEGVRRRKAQREREER